MCFAVRNDGEGEKKVVERHLLQRDGEKIELLLGWLSSFSFIYDKENGQLGIFLLDICYYKDHC